MSAIDIKEEKEPMLDKKKRATTEELCCCVFHVENVDGVVLKTSLACAFVMLCVFSLFTMGYLVGFASVNCAPAYLYPKLQTTDECPCGSIPWRLCGDTRILWYTRLSRKEIWNEDTGAR